MSGPFRFVFTIIWFAIGLTVVGQLKTVVLYFANVAADTQSQHLPLKSWNDSLTK